MYIYIYVVFVFVCVSVCISCCEEALMTLGQEKDVTALRAILETVFIYVHVCSIRVFVCVCVYVTL